jgi:hypothetical protein
LFPWQKPIKMCIAVHGKLYSIKIRKNPMARC